MPNDRRRFIRNIVIRGFHFFPNSVYKQKSIKKKKYICIKETDIKNVSMFAQNYYTLYFEIINIIV